MKRRIYTVEEQDQLRANPNVLRCTDKAITYTKDFKRLALQWHTEEGRSPREIFRQQGFPDSIATSSIPKWALNRWGKSYGRTYVKEADFSDKRGTSTIGRSRKERVDISKMTTEERAVYYEAQAAYLEKENDFLAETRGIKRWPRFVWGPGKNSN